jgi:transcription initiation factor TFIIIB Brf1 subunit/transcription initiation factor TFIIB
MGIRKILKSSINLKERTVDFIVEGTEAVLESAEIPQHLVNKASEIFVEEMGIIYGDIAFDIDKHNFIVKGFYQRV